MIRSLPLISLLVLGAGCGSAASDPPAEEQAAAVYACPMHPDVTAAEPGSCPRCGMTLELREAHDHAAHDHGSGDAPGASDHAGH